MTVMLQATNLDLNVALAKVEAMLRRVLGEDIVMTIAPRATRPQVRADAGQMEQVLMNLVVNARDAMPHGGQLRVETADASPDMLPASAGARPASGARRKITISPCSISCPFAQPNEGNATSPSQQSRK